MSTRGGGPEARTWLRVQMLLKEARTERAQGRYRSAVAKCQEALELIPESPEVLETLGDIHVGAGHFAAGMEAYRKVLETDPGRSEVEEKLARASLSQLGFQRQMDYGQRLLDRGVQADLKKASQIATSLSILFPGLGQLLNRHYWKALVMAVAHLCMLFVGIHVVMDAVHQGQVEHRVEIRSAPRSPYQREPAVTGGLSAAIREIRRQGRMWQVCTLGCLDLALYAWAILDAGLCALRREEDAFV